MSKIFKTIILALVSACIFSSSAFAASITPSVTDITLQSGKNNISFDIILETDETFAGAEFGILPSQTDVTFSSLVFSDDFRNESQVQTIKDGCLYFGFFGSSNKYEAGKYVVATVNYTYSGTSARTISLKSSKIVTVDEETKQTSGDTSTPSFTVTIKRSSGAANVGSGSPSGGSASGSGAASPNITVPSVSRTFDASKFTDITDHWAKAYIESAVENEFFAGTSETTFSPDGAVTRAMAVTVLGRFANAASSNAEIPFADVPSGSYYENYVAWGVEAGVVKGISETEFAPDVSITREQIAAMIVRYLEAERIPLPAATDAVTGHSDYSDISEYAVESLTLCYDMGLITGHDTGLLAPQGTLTRAQLAVIMLKLDNYISSIQ